MNLRHAAALAFLPVCLFCFEGCFLMEWGMPFWYLTVANAGDPEHPTFCISSKEGCSGRGYTDDTLVVISVGPGPAAQRVVWALDRLNVADTTPLRAFTYSVAPSGWKTVRGSVPLKMGALYEVQWSFFRCFGRAPDGSCEAFSHEEASDDPASTRYIPSYP
jgi:hypothetical protein